MIIIDLCGGLGNQMFQYALGRMLAVKKRKKVKYWRQSFAHDPNQRQYALDLFQIKLDFATEAEYRRVIQPPGALKTWLFNLVNYQIPYYKQAIVREKPRDWRFDAHIFKVKNRAFLQGYWQSAQYFRSIEAVIRADFSLKHLQMNEEENTLLDLIKTTNSVCVHVRRSDFLTNSVLGFVGLDYYWRGFNYLQQTLENPTYFIFSDDIDWCQANLTFIQPSIFARPQFAGDRFMHDLNLMTHCQSFLIPNSSFAWWAAWLNPKANKTVVSPQKYLLAEDYLIEVSLPEWVKL
jgi:hypothetical protein